MNIAYLSTFYPFRGGIAQFNAALYRQLEKNNHKINAYTFSTQYPNILFPGKTQFVEQGDNADAIPSKRVLNTVNPISYLTAATKIRKTNPDALIVKFWMPFFAPSLGAVASKMPNNTKTIAILDNVIPHEKRIGDIALTKYFLNQYDYFIAMSDVVANDLTTLKPKAKFQRLEHPLYDHFGAIIDKQIAREKLNVPKDKKVLLFFGFIRDYKGLDRLMRAMELLPADYHLLIAGEVYGEFDKYDKIISELKLSEMITKNVRYISDNEVPLFFSASDLCVLPYLSATQSGITAISTHFNLPLLATDTGGLKEIIGNNNLGMICQSAEPEILASSIANFFHQDSSEEYQKSFDFYKKKASWEFLADKILDFRAYQTA